MSIEEILEAIQAYYGDTSRSREETREGLDEVAGELETLLETLED